ncbi:alpha/beta fold hydrolase [Sphingomonas ginkgonis]|uniref:alpha/beta fold hydrolase n=1 Tax=Sphingomonas ginkgonis TaxID=2315330 RepID=UPI001EEFDE31|nr:alpha/beta fold hydrolase [Sphingomonas ginkgonis]
MAARALEGLRRYQTAPDPPEPPRRPIARDLAGSALRDVGGAGPPLVLVPSLINPPDVLDLDPDVSLAADLAARGHRVFLLDWGPAEPRLGLDVAAHVEQRLVPLLRTFDQPPALLGYCLGGTMALAAAQLTSVRCTATLAAPWNFSAYPEPVRRGLESLVEAAGAMAEQLRRLPMEVLQTGFWGLDPARVVAKFAGFAQAERGSLAADRFVRLERWANAGEPLPLPAAKQLVHDLFARDATGRGRWQVGGQTIHAQLPVPALHFTALDDRIAPAAAAPPGPQIGVKTGHVGLVIGRRGLAEVRPRLADFLASPA